MYRLHNEMKTVFNHKNFVQIDDCHEHNTRQRNNKNYYVHRARTKIGQRSLSVVGIKIWNDIPKEMKKLNYYKFKKVLKAKYIMSYKN